MQDTLPEMEAFQIEGYRRMSASRKLQQVCELWRSIRDLALADVRRSHPAANPRELQLRLASRWLDAGTMRRAFGWDPGVEGY